MGAGPAHSRPPALGRLVVRGSRLHPARPLRAVLLLPERRPRLEVVHDELAGGEGVAAVGARHGHQHDPVPRLELAVAVDDRAVHNLPAGSRLRDDFLQRLLRHAGIVLEGHAHIAHLPDEAGYGTYPGLAFSYRIDFDGEIEILALNRDFQFSPL